MGRYVLSSGGRAGSRERTQSAEQVRTAFAALFAAAANVVEGPSASGRRALIVFDIDPAEVEAKIAQLPPGAILEPEVRFTTAADFSLRVIGPRGPVDSGYVAASWKSPAGQHAHGFADLDTSGRCVLSVPDGCAITGLLACAGDHWSRMLPKLVDPLEVHALPAGPTAWWHEMLGGASHDPTRGRGVSVGVIDTGVGPHPALAHVHDVGAFVGSPERDGSDHVSHGTHVCGLIGARPPNGELAGLAPGVRLCSARVFSPGEPYTNQAWIAAALDHLVEDAQVNLVNMSLGSRSRSLALKQSILDAMESGVLCICAAGNTRESAMFPAAYEETVTVTAIGLDGWGPPDSLAATARPEEPERFGDLDGASVFFAGFSCTSPSVDCGAPGVGIVSAVPIGASGAYADMNGTSMAAPLVTAAVAAIVANNEEYWTSVLRERPRVARRLLHESCRLPTGMSRNLVGYGVPSVAGT